MRDMNQAVKLNPNNTRALDERGISNLDRRDFDRSSGGPDPVATAAPRYAVNISGQGSSYENRREGDRIIQDPSVAIKANHYNTYTFMPESDDAPPAVAPISAGQPATTVATIDPGRGEPKAKATKEGNDAKRAKAQAATPRTKTPKHAERQQRR